MRFPMQNQRLSVVPIRPERPVSDERQRIAHLSSEFWLARGFRGDRLPEEKFLHAVPETTFQKGRHAIGAGLFLIPKRFIASKDDIDRPAS